MKKNFLKILFFLTYIFLSSNKVLAYIESNKYYNKIYYKKLNINKYLNKFNLYFYSNKLKFYNSNEILLSGNVKVIYKKKILYANSIKIKKKKILNKKIYKIVAKGNINYIDKNINIYGSDLIINTNKNNLYFLNGKYKNNYINGYGIFDYIKYNTKNFNTIIKNNLFKICYSCNNNLNFIGKKIFFNKKKKIINIKNAYINIYNIPIFYTPYIQILIGKKNKSKFVIPSLKKRLNKIELKIPYYIYYSKNYNSIIIYRYIKNIGNFIETKTKYTKNKNNGLLKFNFLLKKNFFKKIKWILYWKYYFFLNKFLNIHTNYIDSNDLEYFKKIEFNYENMSKGFSEKNFIINFANKYCNAVIKYNKIYNFKKNYNNFQVEPQIDFNYYSNIKGPLNIKLFNQITYFTNVYKKDINAIRLHFEPTIELLFFNNWGISNTKIKFMSTFYKESILKNKNKKNFKKFNFVKRFLPQFKTNFKITLKKNKKIFSKYYQYLEIRAKYLYIPYKNKNSIRLYDTTKLKTKYINIFRDYDYSGIDRISSANQLPIGITTRIYNNKKIEKFRVSLGQIYFFSTKNFNDITKINFSPSIGSDIYVGDIYWYVNKNLKIYGIIEYQNSSKYFRNGDIIIELKKNNGNNLFLSYSNSTIENLKKKTLNTKNNIIRKKSHEIKLISSYNFNKYLFFIGSYYFNFKNKNMIHESIGLKYKKCCWSASIGFSRSIKSYNSKNKYKNKFFLKFELKGIKNKNSFDNIKFISNIFPDQKIF